MGESRAETVRRIERERVRSEARARIFGAVAEPVRVARFALRRRLGAGASGVVYAAFDPRLEREVALKLLTLEAHDEERLLDEARTLARLAHPNVLPVYEAGSADGVAFLVSELVDGGTLRAWAGAPRADADKLRVLLEAARGVAAGHARALVHRDIKPENVLVGSDGRARVADFGLAARWDPGASAAAGTPLPGTLRYMAPEQLAGERADPLSDQFSFCVTAWEILTGQLPFAGASAAELEAAIRAQRFEPVAAPALSRELACLRRGLAAAPGARWPSLEALCEALSPARPRTPWLALAGGALALGAAALAASALLRSDPPARAAGAGDAARAPASPDPGAAEQAVAESASRLAQEGRYTECSRLFATTGAESDASVFFWLGCARASPDPQQLELACAAWRARSRAATDSPLAGECDAANLKAKALARAGDFRGCAETLLAAPATPIGSITLAGCVAKLNDKALYKRQCHYQYKAQGVDEREGYRCEQAF